MIRCAFQAVAQLCTDHLFCTIQLEYHQVATAASSFHLSEFSLSTSLLGQPIMMVDPPCSSDFGSTDTQMIGNSVQAHVTENLASSSEQAAAGGILGLCLPLLMRGSEHLVAALQFIGRSNRLMFRRFTPN